MIFFPHTRKLAQAICAVHQEDLVLTTHDSSSPSWLSFLITAREAIMAPSS